MSRSVHTDPLAIRAERRSRVPFARRGAGDLRNQRAARRALKDRGLVPVVSPHATTRGVSRLPRLVVREPRDGHRHAVTAADVRRLLEQLGPPAYHGLRVVELARGAPGEAALGRFVPIGRLLLFDVPLPPWRVGRAVARRLARGGAVVTVLGPGVRAVTWPGDTLRRFFLEDVLLHELGHHHLQHHGGKRRARLARTRDHEAFAELAARRLRLTRELAE